MLELINTQSKQVESVSYELRAGALNAQSCRCELHGRLVEDAVLCDVREVAGRAAERALLRAQNGTRDQAVSVLREVRSIQTLRLPHLLAVVAHHLQFKFTSNLYRHIKFTCLVPKLK